MLLLNSIYNWFINTVRFYTVLALYGLTLLPLVKETLNLESQNLLVAFSGILVLSLELPAVFFKLIRIRARDELARRNQIEMGKEDVIVNPPKLMLFALFMHSACRLLVFMVVLNAFGLNYLGKESDPVALILLLSFFAFEMLAFIFMYVKTRVFIEPGIDTITIKEDEADAEKFNSIYLPLIQEPSQIRKEKYADIVLLIFGVMAYAPLWYVLNQSAIQVIDEMKLNKSDVFTSLFSVTIMIFLLSILAFIPLRVTFWIEESMVAKRNQIKAGLNSQFVLFAIMTFLPSYHHWYDSFLSGGKSNWPEWLQVTLPPLIYLILLLAIEWVNRKRNALAYKSL